MSQGKFIVFEGLNGCGKGEQITRLQGYLRSLGKAVPIFISGEPNETFDKVHGKNARDILKRDGDPYKNNLEALTSFSENRRIHNEIFIPLLQNGSFVILDRYYHSNFVYQHAQGLPYDLIASKNKSFRIPDLTLILDVPVKVAVERRVNRAESLRKFERDHSFEEKVRENYLELPSVLPSLMGDESVRIIDGLPSPDEVFKEVVKAYNTRFEIKQ